MTPYQCRAARAWLGWSQEELATAANVALSTVRDFEKGHRDPIVNNIESMQDALERACIVFESSPGGPPTVRFQSRIKETDTYLPILNILDDQPNGFLKTAHLIEALELYFNPRGEDAEILEGRSDTRFSQIVRNVVSHRESPSNLIGRGDAEYDKLRRGLRITAQGRNTLLRAEKEGAK